MPKTQRAPCVSTGSPRVQKRDRSSVHPRSARPIGRVRQRRPSPSRRMPCRRYARTQPISWRTRPTHASDSIPFSLGQVRIPEPLLNLRAHSNPARLVVNQRRNFLVHQRPLTGGLRDVAMFSGAFSTRQAPPRGGYPHSYGNWKIAARLTAPTAPAGRPSHRRRPSHLRSNRPDRRCSTGPEAPPGRRRPPARPCSGRGSVSWARMSRTPAR